MQFSTKFWPNDKLAPPSGKSWIHCWSPEQKEQVIFVHAVVVTPVQGTLQWRCWHELTVLSFWYKQLLSLLLPLTGQWCSTIVQVLLVFNADVVLCRWGGQQMSEHYSQGHGPEEPPAQLIRTTCHGQEIVHAYRWLWCQKQKQLIKMIYCKTSQ